MNPRVNLGRSMNTIYALIIFGMGILASWFLFDGMSRTVEQREAINPKYKACLEANTGDHCKIGKMELVVITAKGAK
ncbi:MAG: hypothetical protein ABFD82_23550 [Syntrophaceae bacterium]